MMKKLRNVVCVICHVLLYNMVLVKCFKVGERTAYIVYMGGLPNDNENTLSLADEHHRILSEVVGDEKLARTSRIHSYGKSFNGFAAHLLPHEAERLKEKESIISIFPNEVIKPITSRSWDTIGMPETVKRNLQAESDTIVAIIDTGVYPNLPSFDDKGFGPPPKKWKGTCAKASGNFSGCNNKLIGAQVFELMNITQFTDGTDTTTPLDHDGHGTHVASIATGNPVPGTNMFGYAEGTVRGGVPSARLAMYRICFAYGCTGINLLAAFDKAIYDGVDVISLSQISIANARPYFQDVISIGAFHAQKNGILTACGAGNDGPNLQTVSNIAPWVLTVGANGFDRNIITQVKLGNGKVYTGKSINAFEPDKQMYPLTNALLAKNTSYKNDKNERECSDLVLNADKVKGAIVHCHYIFNGEPIGKLQGAGVISSEDDIVGDGGAPLGLPGVVVNKRDGESIDQYINSTKSPTAVIYKSVTVNRTDEPYVASFSSRGPHLLSRNILKPDLVAPGVHILAGWSPLVPMTYSEDKRVAKYYIDSGTSMATPHAASAAAYVKTFHPEWSPAAIKSALMTTAKPMKVMPDGGALASGSGVIDPTGALNPGLVYDINLDSYISFLCIEGYNSTTLAILVGSKGYDCSKVKPAKGTDGLNYPSMHLSLQKQNSSFSATYYRELTNVGEGVSLYKANIQSPKELSISVLPKMLSFTKPNQTLSFKVDVNGKFDSETSWFLEASLVWSDSSNHNVRSPILVYRNTTNPKP